MRTPLDPSEYPLARLIADARARLRLTLREVEARSGLTFSLIAAVEVGKRISVTDETLVKLAKALRLDIAEARRAQLRQRAADAQRRHDAFLAESERVS